MKVLCILLDKPGKASELAEACYRFTPQVALRGGEAVFLEIDQCRRLFNEEKLILKIKALLERMKTPARVSMGPDVPTALAFAQYKIQNKKALPLHALGLYANPFDRSEYDDPCRNIIWNLQKLGLQTLNDFLTLPQKTLASRFGALGVLLARRVVCAQDLAWPRFIPREKVIERTDWSHDIPVENLESLFFFLKTIIDRTCLRLFGQGKKLLRFQLTFELEKYLAPHERLRKWKFHLPFSQASARNILTLVREHLHFQLQQKPLLSRATAMELQVEETAPLLLAQKTLFHPKQEEEQEAWEGILSRLTLKLGSKRVFFASPAESFLPEKNWVPTGSTNEVEFSNPFPERPMRLLKQAIPLRLEGDQLLGDLTKFKIHSWTGPEILAGEWWNEFSERSYFRVLSQTGEEIWIYHTPDVSNRFFLQGIFD